MIDSGELLGDDLQAAVECIQKVEKLDGGRAGYAQGYGLAVSDPGAVMARRDIKTMNCC